MDENLKTAEGIYLLKKTVTHPVWILHTRIKKTVFRPECALRNNHSDQELNHYLQQHSISWYHTEALLQYRLQGRCTTYWTACPYCTRVLSWKSPAQKHWAAIVQLMQSDRITAQTRMTAGKKNCIPWLSPLNQCSEVSTGFYSVTEISTAEIRQRL